MAQYATGNGDLSGLGQALAARVLSGSELLQLEISPLDGAMIFAFRQDLRVVFGMGKLALLQGHGTANQSKAAVVRSVASDLPTHVRVLWGLACQLHAAVVPRLKGGRGNAFES
jgi:hypothetical protein